MFTHFQDVITYHRQLEKEVHTVCQSNSEQLSAYSSYQFLFRMHIVNFHL